MNTELEQDYDDLRNGRKAGHMGEWLYLAPNGPALWERFIAENPAYYIPRAELQLAQTIAPVLPKYVGNDPVCLAALAHGSVEAFKQKELTATLHFNNVAQIELYDRNPDYIRESKAAALRANPSAILGEHCINIFAEFEIPTKHTKLGMIWGGTLFNEAGFVSDGPPEELTKARLSQLRHTLSGGFLGITQDGNQDKLKIETAYAGQAELAFNLVHFINEETAHRIDGPLGFRVEYYPQSYGLAHYIQSADGEYHFNNSYKLPTDVFLQWSEDVGFRPVYHEEVDGVHFHLMAA